MAGRNPIKLFQFNQKYSQSVGIYLPQSNRSRHSVNSINLIFIISLSLFLIVSIAFLLFDAKSMRDYGVEFFTIISIIEAMFMYLIPICQLKSILKFIKKCEAFIGKILTTGEHKTIAYEKINMKIELLSKLYYFAILAVIVCIGLLPLFYTYVSYFISDLGTESFYLYPPTKWPFDWKTPLGYLVAWLGETAGITAISLAIVVFFTYLFGSCWLFICIVEDITNDWTDFNIFTTDAAKKSNAENRVELMCRFRSNIQIYSDTKQCVDNFNQIYRYSLFTFFLWTILSIASTLIMIQFQLWEDSLNVIEISTTALVVCIAFGYNFLICELGGWVSCQYEMFEDELQRYNWYALPVRMQLMYLIFLSESQHPVNIRSFGGILCSRTTFKEITNKGFSYFMTLRQMRG